MPENDRGIGSEGLEQGGPNLGNDYSRKDLTTRNAGDALTTPNTQGLGKNDNDQDTLNLDRESSRNLSGESIDENEVEDDMDIADDDDDDDDLIDDDEEDDELDKGL